MIRMDKRMTWKEIQETYPDRWVVMDVEWDGGCIESAVVKYADKTSDELYDMQLSG